MHMYIKINKKIIKCNDGCITKETSQQNEWHNEHFYIIPTVNSEIHKM